MAVALLGENVQHLDDSWWSVGTAGRRGISLGSAGPAEPSHRLVGVDGAPLSVLGCTKIAIVVSRQVFHPQMLVVDTLTSEGILGMDFHRENRCSIDISEGVLHFKDQGVTISMGDSTCDRMAVHLVSQLEIPARSKVEVPATVDKLSVNGEMWFVEGKQIKQCPLIFARAVVSPTNGEVAVRVLNRQDEAVMLRAGTTIVRLEQLWQVALKKKAQI